MVPKSLERLNRAFFSALECLCKWHRYPFFPWIVIWNVTKHCNLDCWYCNQPPDNRARENPWAARDALLRLGPKGIFCFGGEPLMRKELPRILADVIDRRPGTYVSLNTNGLLMDRLIECLPNCRQILYSIDALDESNRLTRGCSGEVLFNNLKELFRANREVGSRADIVTHTVITKYNYRGLPDLVAEVKKLDPETPMVFFTLIPHSHPHSVRSDPETRREFEEIFGDIRSRYSKIIINTEARHRIRMNCYRQFFLSFMNPDGEVRICKPHGHLGDVRHALDQPGKQVGFGELLRAYWHLVDVLLLRRTASSCALSCDWHLSLEGYLRGKEMMDGGLLPVFRGNFTPDEADRTGAFIRWKISAAFPPEWLTRFLG